MSLKKQQSLQNSFHRHVIFYKAINANSTSGSQQIRLISIKSHFEQFNKVQEAIECTCGADTIDEKFQLRCQIDDYFCAATINEALKAFETRQQQNVGANIPVRK